MRWTELQNYRAAHSSKTAGNLRARAATTIACRSRRASQW